GDNSGSNLGKRKSVTSTTPKGKKVKAEGKEKSEWWQYYEVLYEKDEDGNRRKIAKCKYCETRLVADNGTSTLRKHITQSCKQNPTRLEDKQGTLQFKLDNSVEGGTSSVATWKHDDDRIYKALIKLFVIGELPFAFVKNEAFVEYTQALNASHKGDDIGRKLLTCITEWGLKNVMTIAVDNASTNNKALDYLGLTEFSNPIERVTKAVSYDISKEKPMSNKELESKVEDMVEEVKTKMGELFGTYKERFDFLSSNSSMGEHMESEVTSPNNGDNDFLNDYYNVDATSSYETERELGAVCLLRGSESESDSHI
ncbi:zinc finger BED domain-containing protein RICESLEEPER 2, partial [Tanacetum coccineum]